MRSNTQNDKVAYIGGAGSGKTTLATFDMYLRTKPVIIIDTISQFPKTDFRMVTSSINELRFWLNNERYSKAIRRANLQIAFRPNHDYLQQHIDKAIKIIRDFRSCVIYFEELELYADQYLNKNSPLYGLFSLARNRDHDIILTVKSATSLKNNIRESINTFYLSNHSTDELIKFILKQYKGDKDQKAALEKTIKNLKDKEFIRLENGVNTGIYKLNKKTANKLK